VKQRGRILPALAFLALVLVGWSIFGGWYGRGPLKHATDFVVPAGATLPVVAGQLQKAGAIVSARAFRLRARLFHHGAPIKAGEFLLPPAASESEIFAILTGDLALRRFVTVPEGMPSVMVSDRLRAQSMLTGSLAVPAEGSVLPQTYDFKRGETRAALLARMQAAMQATLAEQWAHRAPGLPVKTPRQALILASIVEKETGKADERSRVAAVFVNRLRQRIKLQSDPTIIYGLVGGKGTLGRPIKRSEIQQPSPYNTYVVDGLPPGPIANAGRASLEAAANPARTRDLFFVADGTGGHAFTETYDQHQKNVAKLRTMEKQLQIDAVEPADDAPPPAAAGAPADTNPTATTVKPAPAKKPARGSAPPAARQGAAQSTASPPVLPQ
jgi:UPF0755 protein